MMTHAPMTMPMDLLGLQKRRADPLRQVRADETVLTVTDHPQPTKENRTMKPFLTLKDAPTDQTAGSASLLLARYAVERPRDMAEAIRALGENASVTELLGYIQHLDQPTQRSTNDYLRKIADESNAKFAAEQRMKRWGQDVAAAMATPANKRIKPDYAKVY
jgi:hypothetical protein